jgi:hypothetical protein
MTKGYKDWVNFLSGRVNRLEVAQNTKTFLYNVKNITRENRKNKIK